MSGSTIIYENLHAQPRAWMDNGQVEEIRWTPNQITALVDSEEGGRLVLSEVMYPGWRVWVDGAGAPPETAHGVLRAVTLPPGAHTVRFAFRPMTVYTGAGLAAAGWLLLAVTLLVGGKRGRKTEAGGG